MTGETFMLTGALGCIGAWTTRNLVRDGATVVATDLATDPARLRLIMDDDELAQVKFVKLDVTDLKAVRSVVEENGVTHIVHLAGLQIPFCRANPSVGAAVNVVGTINILEAARHNWGQVKGLAYASSLAVLGPAEQYLETPVRDAAPLLPATLYGVYKQANEWTARIYWQDWQIPSVGLRPYIVYGMGRDQGMTSDITKALLATVAGRPYHIRFGGPVGLQYADDVARIFIGCARSGYHGATACNLRNDVVRVEDFVALVKARYPDANLTVQSDNLLPYPYDLDDSGLAAILGKVLHTPLVEAVDATLVMFRDLLSRGQIDLSQLDA
jgi:nucleoside-diphosphate-sugar epimerase